MRREFRLLGDDRDVDIGDLRIHRVDDALRLGNEARGVRAFPLRILRGEMLADVARAGRAQEGVGDRVQYGVGIRVAGQTAALRDTDAAEDQRACLVERMNVDALTDANHWLPRRSNTRSATMRSSGCVILKFIGSPGISRTW